MMNSIPLWNLVFLERTDVILGTVMAGAMARLKRRFCFRDKRRYFCHGGKGAAALLPYPEKETFGWMGQLWYVVVCPETETAVKILAGL
jgi:hypothetical protein